MAMNQYLAPALLLAALLLPTAGALLARVGSRLSDRVRLVLAGLGVGLAIVSLGALQFVQVDQQALGRFQLFFPVRAAAVDNSIFASGQAVTPQPAPPQVVVALPATVTPVPVLTASATETPAPSMTLSPTARPAPTPTITSTSSPPTEPPTATATLEPTATARPEVQREPTATATKKSTRRTYAVEKGDSLRSIAAAFNVSVQALLDANDLTAKQGDNLQIGQKLIIPAH